MRSTLLTLGIVAEIPLAGTGAPSTQRASQTGLELCSNAAQVSALDLVRKFSELAFIGASYNLTA